MTSPTIVSIVEGHGEVKSVPLLVSRIAREVYDIPYVAQSVPHRVPLGKMLRANEIDRVIELQSKRMPAGPGGLLILADSDDACPVERRQALVRDCRVRCEVVLAVREFEAWFLAGIGRVDAEKIRDAKRACSVEWDVAYRPTIHQAGFVSRIDIEVARDTSRSFRRLVSAVGALLG